MFKILKKMKEDGTIGDFLFPSLPSRIKGKVSHLLDDVVFIESRIDGEVCEFITHPNSVYIVQKKIVA